MYMWIACLQALKALIVTHKYTLMLCLCYVVTLFTTCCHLLSSDKSVRFHEEARKTSRKVPEAVSVKHLFERDTTSLAIIVNCISYYCAMTEINLLMRSSCSADGY